MGPGALGIYESRREWLFAHLIGGAAALLLGPTQLWLGITRGHPLLHRILGVVYVAGVAVGGAAAFYLAFRTDFGWMVSVGFGAMSVAWLTATTLALIS